MTAIGIDIGGFKTTIGIFLDNNFDILLNEYSDRATP